jgi:putative FmdB family regulatory protein
MPIYEYECKKCGHTLEALQKLSDKPLRECPECGRHQLQRLVSAPMFRLSGSGWYETDFKSDQERKRNLLDKGDKEPPARDKDATETKATADTPDKPGKPEKKDAGPESAAPAKSRTMVTRPAKAPARKPRPAVKKPATGRKGKR